MRGILIFIAFCSIEVIAQNSTTATSSGNWSNSSITSSSVPNPGQRVSFDITDQINQALSKGQQAINFRLGSGISSRNDALVSYHSFEAANASDRP